MSSINVVRASRIPLAFLCPGSARPPALAVTEESYEARLGRAVHEVLQSLAETGVVAWAEVDGAAAHHGVKRDEVAMLCGMAAKIWPRLEGTFPNALTEIELTADVRPDCHLIGHIDLLSMRGTSARIGDWKTGRKDHDYAQQMRAYAALVLLEDPGLTEATSTIIWIRDGEIENYTMTRDTMVTWCRELVEHVFDWDGTFHPGGHCLTCPRSHECEAATALVRRDVAMITDRELVARVETDIASMPAEQLIDLYRKADLVSYYAYRVKQAVKAHVVASGDVVAAGARLTIETQNRRELDPEKAWPVLEEAGFKSEDFAACIDLSITKVESRIAKAAGRGKGAGAIRELGKKLDEAGAVATRETLTLKEKRA
jgi:hypothetical protein